MHKKALLALLLAMTMLLSGCALIVKDEAVDRATVIVSAGEYAYTKGEVTDMIASQLMYNQQMYSAYGIPYDVTDPANIQESQDMVVDYFKEIAAKNIQAKKMGLDVFTEEEEAAIKASADENWQMLRDQAVEMYFPGTELTGEELNAAVDAQLIAMGYEFAEYEDLAREEKLHEKLRTETVKGVTITEEELQALLDAEIAAAQQTYADDITAYGVSVTYDETVYYRPAGYRLAKQILVMYEPEDQAIIDGLEGKLAASNEVVSSLTDEVYDLGYDPAALASQVLVKVAEPAGVASGTDLVVAQQAEIAEVSNSFADDIPEDIALLMEQLATAQAEADFYAAQLENAKKNGLAHIDARTDEILALVNAEGADWDALMAQYTEDPGMQAGSATAATGYPVCLEMAGTVMDEPFINAAMALEKIGDVSPKTPGMYGYYIVQYAGDVQEGPVALEEVRDELTASALADKEEEIYNAALAQWIEAANVKVNTKALEN